MAGIEGVPEVWSDLHHNIDIDAQGAIRKVLNIEAVKTSIDNILKTRPGERVMLPTFAGGLQDLVFEPTKPYVYNRIADRIRNAITVWDDRLMVETISFEVDADNNEVRVFLRFSIRGYANIFEHSVKLTGV